MPDPAELNKEPVFSEADQSLIDAQKPGVFSPRRLPETCFEDFHNGLNFTCFAGTATITTGVASHPGILRMVTGSSSGDKCQVGMHDAVDKKPLWFPNVVYGSVTFRMANPTTSRLNMGFYGDSLATARLGNNSVTFEVDSSVNQKLALRADTSGTSTRLASSGNIGTNNWVKLDFFRISTGLYFYYNNAIVGTITDNVPTGAVGFGFTLETQTGSIATADIDLAIYEQYISQRFD